MKKAEMPGAGAVLQKVQSGKQKAESSNRGLPASFGPYSAPFRFSTPADPECMVITAYWPLSTGPSPIASSLNGLNTFNPGRRKSWSLPVTIVRSWRRAVAAI